MPTYRVIWRVDIEAESAVAAAERALEVQRDPKFSAPLYEVIEQPGTGERIDYSAPRIAVDLFGMAGKH